jgi:hypothetical protein
MMRLFGREEEMAKLTSWVETRRSFLLYGPAGVGKTRLLNELCPATPSLLRVAHCRTPLGLFLEVASGLWKRGCPQMRRQFKSQEQLENESAANLKGLCLSALRGSQKILGLEHIGFASQQLAASVKQLCSETELPLIYVARSAHMEEAGYLVRHFPDRSERFGVCDFEPSKASEFARLAASEAQLEAENLGEFLSKVVEFSGGNPGAIVSMIRMGCAPKYRSGDWIKTTPLYIDYRLARGTSL